MYIDITPSNVRWYTKVIFVYDTDENIYELRIQAQVKISKLWFYHIIYVTIFINIIKAKNNFKMKVITFYQEFHCTNSQYLKICSI